MGAGPNEIGLSRVHIMQSVNESLTPLGTDYVDLYQIHGYDPLADFEDAAWQLMKGLGIFRSEGHQIQPR